MSDADYPSSKKNTPKQPFLSYNGASKPNEINAERCWRKTEKKKEGRLSCQVGICVHAGVVDSFQVLALDQALDSLLDHGYLRSERLELL